MKNKEARGGILIKPYKALLYKGQGFVPLRLEFALKRKTNAL
jgi:hypothetical protein